MGWKPKRTPGLRLASELALLDTGELGNVKLLDEGWRTTPNHSRPPSRVLAVDIDAED